MIPIASRFARYPVLLFVLVVAGCGGGDAASEGEETPGGIEFADELDVDLSEMTRTETGLNYLDEEEGSGDPVEAGDAVLVHYEGWLPNGMKFDSSVDRDEPFQVAPVGMAQVIAGWNEGLQGMRPGGKRLLVLPPELAYGPAGAGGVIPPNATLVFRVELLEVRP